MKIDKNIKIPLKKCGIKLFIITPIDELEIGDSFFIPYTAHKDGAKRLSGYLSMRMFLAKKNNTKNFTQRQVIEGNQSGIRIWRIL